MKKNLFLVRVLGILLSALAFGADPLGVIFFGDWGTGGADQKKVAARIGMFCAKERCDFIASLGDNFYPHGVESVKDKMWKTHWLDVYGPLKLPFRVALGNHDYLGDVDAQIQYSLENVNWFLPARFYKFTAANAEFFVLDTERFTQTQAKWLEDNLKASMAEWKIVYGHHPIYSYGEHGNNRQLEKELLPILRNRAALYLSGHDHDLQVLQGAPNDPLFVVSGAAAQLRDTNKGPQTLFAASQLGFGHLTIEDKRLRIRLIDDQGLTLYEH